MKTITVTIYRNLRFLGLISCFFSIVSYAQTVGTGYNYKPLYVDVTGGGDMPDTTGAVTLNCDGSGTTDVTVAFQAALDSAAKKGKPLLIPYKSGNYKISGTLYVSCSMIGIGGRPKINQTADVSVLVLAKNMTGWIYNLHVSGSWYPGIPSMPTEHQQVIALDGVNGVTISNNYVRYAMGDVIGDDVQGDDPANPVRNVLIINNTIDNCMRSQLCFFRICDRIAIMNNYLYNTNNWTNPVEVEPLTAISKITNLEFGYNNIYSPGTKANYYSCIINVESYFNPLSPGGNIVSHHNWGNWGVFFDRKAAGTPTYGWKPLPISSNNIEGYKVPGPSAPYGLKSSAITDTSFILRWSAVPEIVDAKGFEIFKNGIWVASTDTTSLQITGLTANTSYSMKVQAKDVYNNMSLNSSALKVTTLVDPFTNVNVLHKDNSDNFHIYPNPLIKGKLNLEGIEGAEKISFFDMTGRLVYTQSLSGSGQETINLKYRIQKGSYVVKISGRTGVKSQLLLVE